MRQNGPACIGGRVCFPPHCPRAFARLCARASFGLPVGEDGAPPDADAVREWRDNLEEDYHVRPLFYLVRDDDHSALQLLLEAVADACGCALPAPTAAPITPASTPVVKAESFIRSKLTRRPRPG